jgi:hypothetical protein
MLSKSKYINEKRSNRSAFLLLPCFVILILFQTNSAHAQNSEVEFTKPVKWHSLEKSVGVVPEIDFLNGGMGLQLCRAKFIYGTQRSIAGNGYHLGFQYNSEQKVSAASFGFWLGLFKRKRGGQIGARAVYFIKDNESGFALRPEIGIGFVKAQLNYGYNIKVAKTEYATATHTLTLSAYFGISGGRIRLY